MEKGGVEDVINDAKETKREYKEIDFIRLLLDVKTSCTFSNEEEDLKLKSLCNILIADSLKKHSESVSDL